MSRPGMQSSVFDTGLGPLEYAVQGDGPALLVSHGAAGGFDQGLILAQPLVEGAFRVVAPSRDGYLRTPWSEESSPQVQADKYARLLDHLGIAECALLGVSAGGPAAIEFALRHPARTRALVLVSSIVSAVRPAYLRLAPEALVPRLLRSRAYRWVMRRISDGQLLAVLGVTPADRRRAAMDPRMDAALHAIVAAAREIVDRRADGAMADIAGARHLRQFPFADLRAPTLAIHGTKDRFAPFGAVARAVAEMPNAELVRIRGAGHLCILTHHEVFKGAVIRFLRTEAT